MKEEFGRKAPLVRLAFAVVALSITLSIGGFIEFLATGYSQVAVSHPSRVAVAATARQWINPVQQESS